MQSGCCEHLSRAIARDRVSGINMSSLIFTLQGSIEVFIHSESAKKLFDSHQAIMTVVVLLSTSTVQSVVSVSPGP